MRSKGDRHLGNKDMEEQRIPTNDSLKCRQIYSSFKNLSTINTTVTTYAHGVYICCYLLAKRSRKSGFIGCQRVCSMKNFQLNSIDTTRGITHFQVPQSKCCPQMTQTSERPDSGHPDQQCAYFLTLSSASKSSFPPPQRSCLRWPGPFLSSVSPSV